MLQTTYAAFIKEHCPKIGLKAEQKLARRLIGYLCRLTPVSKLNALGREMGIEGPLRELRRVYDGSHLAMSRFWRAMFTWSTGVRLQKAARRYGIDEADMMWATDRMAPARIKALRRHAQKDWIDRPYETKEEREHFNSVFLKEIMSIEQYCQRYIWNHLRFLPKYDTALTTRDLKNDMICAGLSAAYKKDGQITDLVHLRNIAWRSACNYAITLLKHHTTKSRQRIVRVKSVETPSRVKIFSKKMVQDKICWNCERPSSDVTCKDCTQGIREMSRWAAEYRNQDDASTAEHDAFMAKFLSTCTAKPALDATKSFMEKRGAEMQILDSKPQVTEHFQTTTVLMHSGAQRDTDGRPRQDLMPAASNDGYDTVPTIELLRSCEQILPERHQRIVAAILGMPEPKFDTWLAKRHGEKSSQLEDRQLVDAACEFYAVPRKDFESSMAFIR